MSILTARIRCGTCFANNIWINIFLFKSFTMLFFFQQKADFYVKAKSCFSLCWIFIRSTLNGCYFLAIQFSSKDDSISRNNCQNYWSYRIPKEYKKAPIFCWKIVNFSGHEKVSTYMMCGCMNETVQSLLRSISLQSKIYWDL